jgi:nicotinamide riboside kinase
MSALLKHSISERPSLEVRKSSPWHDDYTRLNRRDVDRQAIFRERSQMLSSLKRHMRSTIQEFKEDGFDRLERCRMALRVLDENGWRR